MVLDWVSVKDPAYGAMGNYDPQAGSGNDDTEAIRKALRAAANPPHPPVYIPPGVYLVTDTLHVHNGTKIFGAGRTASLLWGALPAPVVLTTVPTRSLLYLGPPDSPGKNITLTDFGIVGGDHPGAHAITASLLEYSDVNVYVNGGWTHMFYVPPGAPEAHGIENCDIKLWQVNDDQSLPLPLPQLVASPNGGIYAYAHVNASWLWASIGSILSNGDGIHIEGGSGSDNDCHISGVLQGVSGFAVSLSGQGTGTHIEDLHCEQGKAATGQFDIEINGYSGVTIGPNVRGSVHLQGCTSPVVIQLQGTATIEPDVTNAIVINGAGNPPLVNNAPSTMGIGYPQDSNLTGLRTAPTPFSPASEVSLILNGDMERFIGPAWGPENIWDVSGFYVATQTGDGLPDPACTRYSRTAAQMKGAGVSVGCSAYWPIFGASELPSVWKDLPITASFKWKAVAPSVNELYAFAVRPDLVGSDYGDLVTATNSLPVESGFYQYTFTFVLTEDFICHGVGLQLSFPDQAVYISEVQAVLGTCTPRGFCRQTRAIGTVMLPANDHRGRIELVPGGRLRSYASAPPTSGADPMFNSPWQSGDLIEAYPPVAAGPVGWLCTAAGTPGTWKAMGNVSGGFANVKEFGAKGDGTTDDTAAIQAAINAAAVVNGTVWFPVGTYNIASTLILPFGETALALIGENMGRSSLPATRIQMTATRMDALVTKATSPPATYPFYRIENLKILGPDIVGSDGLPTRTSGRGVVISGSGVSDPVVYMRNLFVRYFGGDVGVALVNPEDSYFESVSVSFCDVGWRFEGNFNANTLVNCSAKLCRTAGVYTLDSLSNVWVGGVIQSNYSDGIKIEGGSTAGSIGWVFLGTHFENNNWSQTPGTNAVTIDGPLIQHVAFKNCQFFDSTDTVYVNGQPGLETYNIRFEGGHARPGPFTVTANCKDTLFENIADPSQIVDNGLYTRIISNGVHVLNALKIPENAAQRGFFNATPVPKPVVTGSAGGNAALTSLISSLASLGLITDNTSP